MTQNKCNSTHFQQSIIFGQDFSSQPLVKWTKRGLACKNSTCFSFEKDKEQQTKFLFSSTKQPPHSFSKDLHKLLVGIFGQQVCRRLASFFQMQTQTRPVKLSHLFSSKQPFGWPWMPIKDTYHQILYTDEKL